MNKIETALLEIGIPANLLGFGYLTDGIGIVLTDPTCTHNPTTTLYRKVARVNNTTPSRVERAMRHAIEVAFLRCSPEIIYKYFGNSVGPDSGKPTNSEFVAAVTLALRDTVTLAVREREEEISK